VKSRFWVLALCLTPFAVLAEPPSSAPLFAAALTDLQDKPTELARYRGRPLVVNFWARWCGPCREEIPQLVSERARLKDRGLEVVGIAIEDNTESVRDFAKAYDMDYPVLLAKEQGIPLMQALGNRRAGLPYTLVLDRDGKVIASKLGPMTQEEMAASFAAALK
jgi:thiol-disulfide isomerase/thioredoxin